MSGHTLLRRRATPSWSSAHPLGVGSSAENDEKDDARNDEEQDAADDDDDNVDDDDDVDVGWKWRENDGAVTKIVLDPL